MTDRASQARILGVSCDYHDSAAALVVEGRVVAAAEEERFSRVKHDSSLPVRAIESCLAISGIEAGDVDAVVFYEKPLRVLSRVVAARQRRGPAALGTFARELPALLGRNNLVAYRIEKELARMGAPRPAPTFYSEHHLSHAAAAFFPSPFDTAAILTIDGVGEWSTATVGHGLRRRIDQLHEQRYPHSLGLLYSLATAWCGFRPNDGEYKLMGLAPFGEPRYLDALQELVAVNPDGSFVVDAKAVRWWSGPPERLRRVAALLDGPPRREDEPLEQRHADIARSMQELTETIVLRMATHAHEVTGETNLCLGGGVALNGVANGRLQREGPFESIWVQPAPGDAGSAIGAALWYWHQELGHPHPGGGDGPVGDGMANAQLGPRVTSGEVTAWLDREQLDHLRLPDPSERAAHVAARLADGAIVGWVEGRMEFGPRALGHRSILADPRSPSAHRDLNLRVKGRESFRPFAPAVLAEEAADWFDLAGASPYMSFVVPVAEHRRVPAPGPEPTTFAERASVPRSQIPACTHVDGTARVQTVHADTQPAFHALLTAFHQQTGCPVLVNTSFNVAGEPIVCTPDEALRTARQAGLDVLVVEDAIIELPRSEA